MKITPLEIRQKTFEKAFRGLDKDEVNAFLVSLSQEWEKLVDENKELKIKLESSEKEVEKLREVENSLFKTLKTAEDTGANMIDQATKTAELHLKDAQMKSDALLSEAKSKARDMMEEAEMKSRQTTDELESRIRSLAQVYKQLENIRDDLLSDIKSYANDAVDKVNRVKSQIKPYSVEDELMRIKRDTMEASAKNAKIKKAEKSTVTDSHVEKEEKVTESVENSIASTDKNEKSTSFFDDIE